MLKLELDGIQRLLDKATPEYLLSTPLRNFFKKASDRVASLARAKAPRDSGRLANSIVPAVDGSSLPLWATVGTQAGVVANAMEYGTGLLSEAPDSQGGVHFPPWGENNPGLEAWAQEHGIPNGFLVARAIGRQGGLRPRRYLRAAFEESLTDIRGFIQDLGAEIGARWSG